MAANTTDGRFNSTALYVGDLHKAVTEAQLFEIFNSVGPVASVRVCRDAQTRASLGYAYVNFLRAEDAQRAIDAMNFSPINNQPCRIMWSHRDPTLRRSGKGNLFIKNLPRDIDTAQLHDIFSRFGDILSCKVATNEKRESLGYGFVHFTEEKDADKAIDLLNNKRIVAGDEQQSEDGPTLVVAPFKSKAERSGGKQLFTNIYVKNLPKDWTKEQMDEAFGAAGEITSSTVAVDEEGKGKGFGFVNFMTHEQAEKAIETLHDKVVAEGEPALYVARAQSKTERLKELEQQRREHAKKYVGVNLYIKNLPDETTDEDLVKMFEQFGDITSTKVMRYETGKSRGFGFVCFSTPEEATQAVTTMNGHRINNKPLYVGLAQPKNVRRAQLEAQNLNRSKMGMVHQQGVMYLPPGGFYPQVPGAQGQQGQPGGRFMYPQMMPHPRGGFVPPQAAQGGRMVRPGQVQGQPGTGYQLMPLAANGQPGGPRGGPQQGGRGGPQRQQAGPPQGGGQIIAGQTPEQPESSMPTMTELAAASPEDRKRHLGESLYPKIYAREPQHAAKITGMLLEMDPAELLNLLEDDRSLQEKIQEAMEVLDQAKRQEDVEVDQVVA